MPQVPQYQQQVAPAQVAIPQAQEVDVSSGSRAVAQGLGQVAEVADQFALRDDTTAALKAHAAIQQDWLETDTALRDKFKGDNVAGYTDGAKQFWADAPAKYGADLSPRAQRMISQELTATQLRAQREAFSYVQGQKKQSLDTAYTASVQATINAASVAPLAPVPDGNGNTITAAEKGVRDMQKTVGNYLVANGINDPTVRQEMLNEQLTKLHMQNLQAISTSGSVTANQDAQAYYDKYKDQISGSVHAEVEDKLKKVGLANFAQDEGAKLADKYTFKQTGDAIKDIYAHKDWTPEQKTAAVQQVEHLHAVQRSDYTDKQNDFAKQLSEMVQNNRGMAEIMKSPAYLNYDNKGAVLESYRQLSEHKVNLAAAVENRDWAKAQRLELEQSQKTAAKMYDYKARLSTMSMQDIEGLRVELGNTNTNRLLDLRATMEKPGKAAQVRLDQGQFDQIADAVGLKPYATTKTPAEKAALGAAKERVEDGMTAWQLKHGVEMPRDEKEKLMRREAAAEVTTKGFFWTSRQNALTLSREDISKIVVPEQDEKDIVDSFQRKQGRMPNAQEIRETFHQQTLKDAALNAK